MLATSDGGAVDTGHGVIKRRLKSCANKWRRRMPTSHTLSSTLSSNIKADMMNV